MSIASPEAEILSRLISPQNADFSPEAARSILAIQFGDDEVERMNLLADKASKDELTEQEASQLHGYLFVGAMMDLLHSKARISLKQAEG